MPKTLLLLPVLASGLLFGCGANTATVIPPSVSADELQQLQEAEKRVEEEERHHQMTNF